MAVVALGVFVAADDLMVVATMLRPMIRDLGLALPDDLDRTAWIVNVYLIAYLAVMPLAGRLSDVLGRRTVFMGALGVFLIGSLVVPRADSLGVLLVGRALTAIGGGALVPVALAVAGDLYTGARRTRALGGLSAMETLGWVWGPLYGALLVRYASWQWQFHLNIPLAVIGMVVGWWALDPVRRASPRIDWGGAALFTAGLVAVSVALLGQARIQSVTGLAELTAEDQGRLGGPWLYAVALAAFAAAAWLSRRVESPFLDLGLLRGRTAFVALVVNVVVGVGLVVALVNVPLFVNVVEGGIQRSAVLAGWLLTAFTATMAGASYAGGAIAGRAGNRPTTVVGLTIAVAGFALMGGWTAGTAYLEMGAHLALLGLGIGLVLAPTTAAVVDAAADEDRGTAAGLVIVFRLVGFTVGLAALTAWGLRRYGELRAELELPPLGAPGAQEAMTAGVVEITTTALSETFLGAGLALAVGWAVAWLGTGGARRWRQPRLGDGSTAGPTGTPHP